MIFQNCGLTEKKLLLLFLSVLLCWWLFLAPGTCSASGMYQITEQELSQLETNLRMLEQISQTQKTELTRLKEALTKSEQELATLKSQLTTSAEQLTTAQTSLSNANKLLQEYAAEAKRERLRIKAQRNGWIAATILACIGLAIK